MAVDASLLTRLALTNILLGQAAAQANLLYQEAMEKGICDKPAADLIDLVLEAMVYADRMNDCLGRSGAKRKRRK